MSISEHVFTGLLGCNHLVYLALGKHLWLQILYPNIVLIVDKIW
jgi:hypothetical protein